MILLFALLNSSLFIAIGGSGFLRFIIIILMNLSGFSLVYFFLKHQKRFKIIDVNYYFKLVFVFLILWSLSMSIRSFSFNSSTLISLFGHYLMGWAWLTPLAIIFGFNIFNWIKLFKFFGSLLIIVIILSLGIIFYNQKIIFGLLEWMAFMPVLFLTFFIQKRKNKIISIFSLLVYIVLTFFASQRANLLFLLILSLFFLIEFYKRKGNNIKKLFLFLIFIGLGFFLNHQYNNKSKNLVGDSELTSDTRTFLFVELFQDLTYFEKISGRGTLGKYYSPYFDLWNQYYDGGDSEYRSLSEVGYLQMILKGGIILVILNLLILLPASFLGIFRSNNLVSKMCGYFIFSYLILWTVSYYPVYSVEYILLWMAVGTVLNPNARSLYNKDIISRIKNKQT